MIIEAHVELDESIADKTILYFPGDVSIHLPWIQHQQQHPQQPETKGMRLLLQRSQQTLQSILAKNPKFIVVYYPCEQQPTMQETISLETLFGQDVQWTPDRLQDMIEDTEFVHSCPNGKVFLHTKELSHRDLRMFDLVIQDTIQYLKKYHPPSKEQEEQVQEEKSDTTTIKPISETNKRARDETSVDSLDSKRRKITKEKEHIPMWSCGNSFVQELVYAKFILGKMLHYIESIAFKDGSADESLNEGDVTLVLGSDMSMYPPSFTNDLIDFIRQALENNRLTSIFIHADNPLHRAIDTELSMYEHPVAIETVHSHELGKRDMTRMTTHLREYFTSFNSFVFIGGWKFKDPQYITKEFETFAEDGGENVCVFCPHAYDSFNVTGGGFQQYHVSCQMIHMLHHFLNDAGPNSN